MLIWVKKLLYPSILEAIETWDPFELKEIGWGLNYLG